MKMLMCSVFDTTNSKFMAPWYAQNEEDAKRSFKLIMNGNDLMKQNPSDFECYVIAQFDDDRGIVNDNYLKSNIDYSYEPLRLYKGGEILHEA